MILSLLSNPAAPAIDTTLKRRAEDALAAAGARFAPASDLAPGVAMEYRLDPAPASILAELRAALADAPVDVNLVSPDNRRKKLLIADMDSTVIEQECIDELAAFAGLRDEIAAVTERAMRGELDFDAALTARVARLKGLPVDALDRTFAEKISLTPGAATLTRTMRAHGAVCLLASGGFTFFTERVAAAAGFNQHTANVLEGADGKLTGAVRAPIFGREGKAATLAAGLKTIGAGQADSLAVGDGANDLAMIDAAGLGVAFRAKPAVAAAADAAIAHCDLTGLLYLQGYGAADIADAAA